MDATSSVSNANDVGQNNDQKQSQKGTIVNDNGQRPSNTTTKINNNSNTTSQLVSPSQTGSNNDSNKEGSAAAVNNGIAQAGMQVADNYNEQNNNSTINQGVIGNPVNAGIDVSKNNNATQNDEQRQSQKAAITTSTPVQ
jgi:hypothetical protein